MRSWGAPTAVLRAPGAVSGALWDHRGGGVLGPRRLFFWRLGGSPGLLFGDILSPREGFAATTVTSFMLMTLSSELFTFRDLGGLKIRSKSLLGALGAPLDVKMEFLGATRLPKRGFWRLRGRLGTPKWSSRGLRLTSPGGGGSKTGGAHPPTSLRLGGSEDLRRRSEATEDLTRRWVGELLFLIKREKERDSLGILRG